MHFVCDFLLLIITNESGKISIIINCFHTIFSYKLGGMFETSAIPVEYDPLANIAEFAIQYNSKFGTNHIDFFQGSYTEVILIYLNTNIRSLSNILSL